jgi:hypothetical protein
MANLVLSVMGAFAKVERSLIRERHRPGQAVPTKGGRRPSHRNGFPSWFSEARRQVLLERLAEWPPEGVHQLADYMSKLNTAYDDRPTEDSNPEETKSSPPPMPSGG